MSKNKKDDRLKQVEQEGDEKPEVYGIVKDRGGFRVGRRAFFGSLGIGMLAAATGYGATDKKMQAQGAETAAAPLSVKTESCSGLKAHLDTVHSLAISPDGKVLASGSGDDTIKLWSLPGGQLATTLTGHTNSVFSLAISPDGKMLASGSGDKTIRLWSLPGGQLVATLVGHAGVVSSLAISPDGKVLASGSGDKTIKLWSLVEGAPGPCLFDPASTEKGTKVGEYRQMGKKIFTLPCGFPTPPGAICICDCIAGSGQYSWVETVCICNTIMVPVGSPIPAGAVCICHTIAVGTYTKPSAEPSPGGGRGRGRGGGCPGYCTCDMVQTGHYWYPN